MALSFVCLAAALRSWTEDARPNVVLVTIDTLRPDYLRCYGNRRIETPTLDALAADGTLFERAYCQAPMTPPSHATILTGTYPPTHGVRDFTSAPLRGGFPTLATILKNEGYATAAFVSAYVLDSAWGLNQGFDLYFDRFDPKEFPGANTRNLQRRARETINLVLNWLNRGVPGPYFLWVHLYDPHHDYNPPEPYHSRYVKDLYAGEVAYADAELGRFMAALRQRGEYDNSLIVAASDHGEAFGEHDESEHGFFIYNTTTHIPLIIKLPHKWGRGVRRVKEVVETVDIAPTIMQVTRGTSRKQVSMQGTGLLALILGKASPSQRGWYSETLYPRKTFGWSDLASYAEGRFKYISSPRPEMYDLDADTGEKNNIYNEQRAMAALLRQRLEQFKKRLGPPAPETKIAADPQRVEALRALGYVGVSAPLQKPHGLGGLIDPKDRIHTFNKFLLALQASDAGALGRSNALLEELVAEDPELFIVHYSLGTNRVKAGENEKALEHFARAKSLNPSFDLIDLTRAAALGRLGRLDEAISLLLELLRQTPSRLDAKRQLGQLYSRKKDFGKAIEIYQGMLAGRPEDSQATKALGIAQVDAELYEQGASTLKRAISLGLDEALVHNYLGIAQSNQGQTQEALASYKKALAKKQDYHQARLNLSFALLKAGQQEEARREFAILCRADPRLCEQYRRYFP